MVTQNRLRSILRCPGCHGPLALVDDTATCTGCGVGYPSSATVIDLRLRHPRDHPLVFRIGERPLTTEVMPFTPLVTRTRSEVDFTGAQIPEHLTKEMLSHFPSAPADGGIALDLGCGWGVHRPVIERAGYEWVGLDYDELGAPLLGDAHALPFADESFDFILTIAVLEHLRYPFVAMHEAYRVLKTGQRLIGTVAFLEPFHGDSHYHHTHLGVVNTLRHAGFDVEFVAPHADWGVIRAQAEMGLFPAMSTRVRRALVEGLERLSQRSFRRAKALETARLRSHAGAFTFIASKPARARPSIIPDSNHAPERCAESGKSG